MMCYTKIIATWLDIDFASFACDRMKRVSGWLVAVDADDDASFEFERDKNAVVNRQSNQLNHYFAW